MLWLKFKVVGEPAGAVGLEVTSNFIQDATEMWAQSPQLHPILSCLPCLLPGEQSWTELC